MKNRKITIMLSALLFLAASVSAQTTQFTYQGKLTDGGNPATANYDMQFRLFDNPTAGQGTQQGATVTNSSVPATNGIFTVVLDFGSQVFATGADLYLEISVRPAGSAGGYASLAPRQKITSAPYAIRALGAGQADVALNSNKLGGIDARQFVSGPVVTSLNSLTNDVTLAAGTGVTITPTGSTLTIASAGGSFNNNQTTLQTGANFNIGATGTADIFNARTQYNIGGARVLSNAGFSNLFAGVDAGNVNTGGGNSFVGGSAGKQNTTGTHNSFVGSYAGDANTTGSGNAFFGAEAGYTNTHSSQNSFIGAFAGYSNTVGAYNSFIGNSAGELNTTGINNSFVGTRAGNSNTTGSNNTIVGTGADVGADNLSFATAIGAQSRVSTSNTIVLGRANGSDKVVVYGLGAAGSEHLCRNASNQISACSSSLRYKTNIAPFSFGLNLVNQLRPISFDWKTGGTADVGFGAEDVARVNPLFVTHNDTGAVEGVKYDRLSVVFVNAIKEQQTQIERQDKQIKGQQTLLETQQRRIDALTRLVCSQNSQAQICKEQ